MKVETALPATDLEAPPAARPQFVAGHGLRLIADDGSEYLDAVSGTFNVPLGYDHPEVVDAVIAQLRRCAHLSSTYSGAFAQQVLDALLEIAPPGLGAGWMRDLVGSTANECAVKIAQKATGASDVVSFHLSHHGQTLFTTAISGNAFRRSGFPDAVSPHSIKVAPPYCLRCPFHATFPSCGFRCVEAVEDAIRYASSGSVACLIVEPVFGNGGNIVPPPGYFEVLSEVCARHGVLLIADEVQTGLGRTGFLFAAETFGFTPDLMTLAKGLGGIGVPIAAVLMRDRLDVLAPHDHSFTSGGNLLGLAAAAATLRVLGGEGFMAGVRERGALLGSLLEPLFGRFRSVADVRGVGMMWGVEIVAEDGRPDPDKTARILACAERRHKLILRGSRYGLGNVIKVRPALVATQEELEEIADKLGRAIREVEAGGR
ncbi:MAG TPA: aminotransferase class III-fold pyridoxal phosphate-dependent enzyme [Thermoanaerobaculia bacterium]|nr:aminotransferase class III-fold pyridoxal phosphate-dependent enzyme [Thermoanaerobaculia bacterium]